MKAKVMETLKSINWEVRIKNPVFWAHILFAVLAPVLAYAGLKAEDLTSWTILFNLMADAVKNPYVLFLVAGSVWGVITDTTTKGFGDSKRALGYKEPADSDKEFIEENK